MADREGDRPGLAAPERGATDDATAQLGLDAAWAVVTMARRAAEIGVRPGDRIEVRPGEGESDARPVVVSAAERAVTSGIDRFGGDARDVLDLFLDLALTPPGVGRVTAMLGQSVDGYIATLEGHSSYVSHRATLVHQHRLRAMSDAVIVGAATARIDRPRLTTRLVAGRDPVRVVLDPSGRLPVDHDLVRDGLAPTLVLRAGAAVRPERRLSDHAVELLVPADGEGQVAPGSVLEVLADRGLTRVLVEGGGVTVTRFLQAGRLDRLQLAVAPLLLGRGRPAIDLPAVARLEQGLRPRTRTYRLGDDVLFDMVLEDRIQP